MSLLFKDLFNKNHQSTSINTAGIDISVENFEKEVLEASFERVVLLDFWAPWCGPCQSLTPTLEKFAGKYSEKIKLAKINIDQQQQIAVQFRIQSVPTVIAFYQGRPVDAFMGALPESQIRQFVEKIVGPLKDGIKELLQEAGDYLNNKLYTNAFNSYLQALQQEPDNPIAHAGAARSQALLGDFTKAQEFISPLANNKTPEVISTLKLIELLILASNTAASLKTSSMPTDKTYNNALEHFAKQEHESCIAFLLNIIKNEREWQNRLAEKTLLDCFTAIGNDHPATLKGRRQLASILFA